MDLDAFEIAPWLVTNHEFTRFLNSDYAKQCRGLLLWAGEGDFHYDVDPLVYEDGTYRVRSGAQYCPASRVTWFGAVEYCHWLTSLSPRYRYRLPTEWEWEYAARGSDARAWPWGDESPAPVHGFTWQAKKWGPDPWRLCPVGSHPRNATPEGVMDMLAYPLWEWCSDPRLDDFGQVIAKATRVKLMWGAARLRGLDILIALWAWYSDGSLKAARGGPSRSVAWMSFFDDMMSATQHPGRVWTRCCMDGAARAACMGFRVVRDKK